MPHLAIFDFDDTILILGIDWGEVKDEVAALAGRAGIKADKAEHLVPLGNRLSAGPEMKKAIDEIYLKYEKECAEMKRYAMIPEMVALIKGLRAKGVQLAIASGNHTESIRLILPKIGLEGCFDFICGRDSVERNKPAPDQLELILRELGAARADAIFIGDSINDENAAKAAGIRFFRLEKGLKKNMEGLRKALE
jgi:phosphoglycolate phosphatase